MHAAYHGRPCQGLNTIHPQLWDRNTPDQDCCWDRKKAIRMGRQQIMEAAVNHTTEVDPGLAVLAMMLRFHGIAADPEQLRHRFGRGAIRVPEMLRCAKELGLRARGYTTNWARLNATPLPGIAVLRDGGFLFLAKVGGD